MNKCIECLYKKVCPNTVGVACWEQYLEHMDRKAGAE